MEVNNMHLTLLKSLLGDFKKILLFSFFIFVSLSLLETYFVTAATSDEDGLNSVMSSVAISYLKGAVFLFLLTSLMKKVADVAYPIKMTTIFFNVLKTMVAFSLSLLPIIAIMSLLIPEDMKIVDVASKSGVNENSVYMVLAAGFFCFAYAYAVSIMSFVRFTFQSQVTNISKAHGVSKRSSKGYENGYFIPFKAMVVVLLKPGLLAFVIATQLLQVLAGYLGAASFSVLPQEVSEVLAVLVRSTAMASYLVFIPVFYQICALNRSAPSVDERPVHV
jgi:hypothetical protein